MVRAGTEYFTIIFNNGQSSGHVQRGGVTAVAVDDQYPLKSMIRPAATDIFNIIDERIHRMVIVPWKSI